MSVAQRLADAFDHHQSGNLPQAEALYRQIVADAPNCADAWHLLGVALHQQQRHREGAELIGRAIALVPDNPTYFCHLGAARGAAGDLAAAETAFRQALAIQPADPHARYNLATALAQLGRRDEAIAGYEQALRYDARYLPALFNLGNALRDAGRCDEAIRAFEQALAIEPNYFEALNNLGALLQSQGRSAEAGRALRQALQLRPDYLLAKNNLGEVLRDEGQLDQAIALFEEVIAADPQLAEAHNNLGTALHGQRRYDEAIAALRQALVLRPDYHRARYNLAAALGELRRHDEAIETFRAVLAAEPDSAEACNGLAGALLRRGDLAAAWPWIERALELKPDFAEAHQNRATWWLSQDNFEQGWPEFEWRRELKGGDVLPNPERAWNGQPLPAGTLLLIAEQGFGDTFQFMRFAAAARERVGRLLLACPPQLTTLFARCLPEVELVPSGALLPPHDAQASLMSLPALLALPGAALSQGVPYLHPPKDLVVNWRARLAKVPGVKVGIVWQGSPKFHDDRYRSAPLVQFAPLAAMPDVTLVSLQKGFGSEQLPPLADAWGVVDLAPELDLAAPFLDTAAAMHALDLVITTDTAAAHLAGALGVPVWVALEQGADWRWRLDGDACPWYPSMRLFRQPAPGDWPGVFACLAEALEALSAKP